MRTAQQIADAAAKRRATQAANRAAGVPTVRQQRAAKRAAKAAAAGQTGQTYAPPPPRPRQQTRRSRFSRPAGSVFGNNATAPAQPLFAPKPNTRALKLAALASLEAVFTQKLQETGITEEIRAGYATYKKLKALALGATTSTQMQTEADSALRMATAHLIKLSF